IIVAAIIPLFSAEKTPVQWAVADAGFRMKIDTDRPELTGYLDLSRYCLPVSLANGVDVRDAQGMKLPFYLYPNGGLILGSSPNKNRRYVYLGFASPENENRWNKALGKIPANSRIKMTVINGKFPYLTETEWVENQGKILQKRYQQTLKYQLDDLTRNLTEAIFSPSVYYWQEYERKSGFYPRYNKYRQYWKRVPQTFMTRKYIPRQILPPWDFEYSFPTLFTTPLAFRNNINWRVKRIKNVEQEEENKIKELPKKAVGAPEKDFLNWFTRKKMNIRGEKEISAVYLPRLPFNTRRNFGAIISGNLVVPADGEYEFAVNSTSSTALLIDEKTVIMWYGVHERTDNWTKTVKLQLTRGLHSFVFYYHKNNSAAYATAAWKKVGANNFSPLTEDEFSPGWLNHPVSCENRLNKQYPLVKHTAMYWIFTGKQQKALWEKLTIISGDASKYEWEQNGKVFAKGSNADIIFSGSNPVQVVLRSQDKTFSELAITSYSGDRELEPLRPDLFLKLNAPDFIYDDEILDFYLETVSKLPEPVDCAIETTTDNPGSGFTSGKINLTMPGKIVADQERFTPDSVHKSLTVLNGKTLKDGANVEFSLSVTGMTFDRKQIRFMPLAELPELQYETDGLKDGDNVRIIPILHRPTLSEVRKWQLPSLIRNQLSQTKKLLVIGDDFSSLNSTLANNLKQKLAAKNIQLEFYPWQQTDDRIIMLDSLTSLLPAIKQSTADIALIIPPAADLSDEISTRTRTRIIAALVEALKNNPNIRTIKLSTPFPGIVSRENEPELVTALKKLVREYNIQIIDLNFFIRNQEDWQKAYCKFPDNEQIIEPFPVQKIPEISDFISAEIE
ncbi:MAG: PA14 domain-containing protein, partial [Victivallaceae bacterium]